MKIQERDYIAARHEAYLESRRFLQKMTDRYGADNYGTLLKWLNQEVEK